MKLNSIIKVKEGLKKYSPEILTGVGVVSTILQSVMVYKSPRNYMMLYNNTGEEKYLVKYLQLTKSNNWLKIHGYPMRRNH